MSLSVASNGTASTRLSVTTPAAPAGKPPASPSVVHWGVAQVTDRQTILSKGVSVREPALVALETLRTHKLRSFLMLLGVILAVSTLIVVVALITGANQYIASRVVNMGTNVFLVTRFPLISSLEDFAKYTRRNRSITWEDYEALLENLKLPKNIGVDTRTNARARYGNTVLEDVNLRGVTASIGDMDVEQLAEGRYITTTDESHRTTVAVLGSEVATKTFPGVDPIGKTMELDGRPYEVVGIMKELGNALGQSQDRYAYIPVQTFLKTYSANGRSLDINVQARSPEWMERTQEEARVLMRARRHLRPGEDDNFGILSSAVLLDLFHQLTGAIASSMVGVAAVFLVIGGVVIMNVMLASVTERTREIGIRKSLGARKSDILLQFLVESAVMSGMGGVIGVLVAYGISALVNALTPVPMSVPLVAVVVAIVVSTGVGLFFGLYPARRAAQLDPVEALRFEA